MKITTSVYVPYPRLLVYATYRDKLIDVVPFLPDVRQIEIQSRREENGRVYFTNIWHGGGEIPVLARAILNESMLSWTDYATWHDAEFTTEWRIKPHAFTEAVYCAGKNQFLEAGNGTRIESRGELTIDPRKITGVPSFLAGKIGQTVEEFLGQKIEPNLLQVSQGVQRYLEQTQKQGVL